MNVTAKAHRVSQAPTTRMKAPIAGVEAPFSTKPLRRVLKWQAATTVAIALIAMIWGGAERGAAGALSALLGGTINIVGVIVYAVVLGLSNPTSAGGTVAALFRAEASKILVIIVQLALVMTTYKDVVPAALFAAFVVTVLMFRMALIDRD